MNYYTNEINNFNRDFNGGSLFWEGEEVLFLNLAFKSGKGGQGENVPLLC